jgi:hypothetical protein
MRNHFVNAWDGICKVSISSRSRHCACMGVQCACRHLRKQVGEETLQQLAVCATLEARHVEHCLHDSERERVYLISFCLEIFGGLLQLIFLLLHRQNLSMHNDSIDMFE